MPQHTGPPRLLYDPDRDCNGCGAAMSLYKLTIGIRESRLCDDCLATIRVQIQEEEL